MGDVEYGFIQTADEIPGGRGGRGGSRLNDMVDEIIEHGEKGAYCIAVYVKKTAAGGAANVMRQRYGRNIGVRGLTFASRRTKLENGDERTGLWVYYDPDAVVDGELAKHEKIEKARKVKLAAQLKANKEKKDKEAEKEAEKAKAQNAAA